MSIPQKISNFICKVFGHRWTYYILPYSGLTDSRHCKCCNRLQIWTIVNPIISKFGWSFITQYTDKGAREDVKGYGLE